MVKQASLLTDLESIAGHRHVSTGDEQFSVDGLLPQAVVRPGSYAEVAEVLRYANGAAFAVIPWGGGTAMGLGNTPCRYDIALCLSRLNKVTEHEPADLTATCQAGMSLQALRKHLAAAGQMVPFDPSLSGRSTIGGLLATNAYGPARHAYGAARDFTIGLRVVTADGRLTRAGGRVVKNVAGYDLCKLYVGSLGTLGVIVEATFKVAPLPKAERRIVLRFPSAAAACGLAADAHRWGLSLRGAELLNESAARGVGIPPADGGYLLLLDLAGGQQAVERSQREIEKLAAGAGARALTVTKGMRPPRLMDPTPAGTGMRCRASVLPGQAADLIVAIGEATGAETCIVAYPTLGALRVAIPGGDGPSGPLQRLREAVRRERGTLVVESCPATLKREIDVFGQEPPSFGLMRRVKEQFDPNGTLSPGRYLGRL